MEAVTVVVPTRNRRGLLALTLRSVLRQRHVDLHVVVVDDASTEDVGCVVSGFADPRVRISRQPSSRGVSAARNRGLGEAATEWVAFCDDDDLWSPDKLWRQLAAARTLHRGWAYAGCVYVDNQLVVQSGEPPLGPEAMTAALDRYNAMPAGASNVLVQTDLLRSLGGFDSTLTHLPDWDLWLRLARRGVPACVGEPLVGYRLHAGNASFRTEQMLAELYGFERRHQLTTNRSRFHRHLAYLCLRSGRYGKALGYFGRAMLRFWDGYSRIDVFDDLRLMREHAGEIVGRRLGRPFTTRVQRRLEVARGRDSHAMWKAQAQAWLDELTSCARYPE